MSYFPKGHHDTGDEVDDFDEYDPTPYGGGYDIALTYGRPIPPSDETCYPVSSSTSDEFDYDRPQYTSYAEPSAYGDEALDNEYKSYSRPKPRPHPTPYGGPPPSQSGYGRPEYGRPEPEFGSGYGRKPEYKAPEPEYGSGYGRKPEVEEYGSGYGRKPEYEAPEPEYESGYGRKPEVEEYGSGGGYGRRPAKSEYEEERPPSYGRSEYEQPAQEYGSGYGRRPESEEYGSGGGYGRKPVRSEYEEHAQEYGSGYGRRPEAEEYGSGGGYGRRPVKSEYEEEKPPSYGRTSYQSEGFERPSYGRSEEEDYRKPSYERRDDDEEESYGRKKYVSCSCFSFVVVDSMFDSCVFQFLVEMYIVLGAICWLLDYELLNHMISRDEFEMIFQFRYWMLNLSQ